MRTLPPLGLDPLPPIDLRHMLMLTDDTGIAQHATFSTPDFHHGYCTDDNARALIAAIMARQLLTKEEHASEIEQTATPDALLTVLQRYLAFLNYAFNPETKCFRNFMSFDRRWLEETGSQDSHARALWALGVTVSQGQADAVADLAERLFHDALGALKDLEAIRPWAYAIIGIEEYLKARPDNDQAAQRGRDLGVRLLAVRQDYAEPDWPWWEETLTWGNAKLPHALLELGHRLGDESMMTVALESLRWLLSVQTDDKGHLSIIGNAGWYVRGGVRARFDQQPIEAKALVQACLCAARVTGDAFWTGEAVRCFEWFAGRNDLGIPLRDVETGGCHDGLMRDRVNANEGAESTLAYVLSVLELHAYDALFRRTAEAP